MNIQIEDDESFNTIYMLGFWPVPSAVYLPEHILYPGAVEPEYQSDQWVSTKIPSWVVPFQAVHSARSGIRVRQLDITVLYIIYSLSTTFGEGAC